MDELERSLCTSLQVYKYEHRVHRLRRNETARGIKPRTARRKPIAAGRKKARKAPRNFLLETVNAAQVLGFHVFHGVVKRPGASPGRACRIGVVPEDLWWVAQSPREATANTGLDAGPLSPAAHDDVYVPLLQACAALYIMHSLLPDLCRANRIWLPVAAQDQWLKGYT